MTEAPKHPDEAGETPAVAVPVIIDPDPTAAEDYEVGLKSLNQWQLAWRKFRKHKLALIGLAIIALLIGVAIIGPVVLPFAFTDIPRPDQMVQMGRPPFCQTYDGIHRVCQAWTLAHPMGETGGLQRDVMTLVINGARTSLLIGFSSMAIGVFIGTLVGAIAGFAGGVVDNLLMRLVDVMLSLPTLFVILVAAKFLGQGTVSMIIVIFGLLSWMGISRLVRSLFLSIREREFVEAALAVGVRDRRIIFRHILPNAFSPIVVASSLIVAGNIISEAFVSFLGFGVDPTSPTWGNILSGGLQFIALGNWWWPLFPGLAIIVTVLAVNFVGDGLRDAFDPRSRV
ncbi:MAG: ABC transporter permease [Chloroflexota bacterium]